MSRVLIEQMKVKPELVQPDQPLANLGIDSLQLIALVGQLEEKLGCTFASNPLEKHPTIEAVSRYVAGQLERGVKRMDPLRDDDGQEPPPSSVT